MISLIARALLSLSLVALTSSVNAQQRRSPAAPLEPGRMSPPLQRAAVITPALQSTVSQPPSKSLLVGVPFADVGFPDGFRFSNLGGRREVYVPVPQGVELNLADLVLSYDDVSAHDARRSLEILVNDRSVASLPLDGKGIGRTVRIPLATAAAREGFLSSRSFIRAPRRRIAVSMSVTSATA